MTLLFVEPLRQPLGMLAQECLPLEQGSLTLLTQFSVAQDVTQGHLGRLEPLDEIHPVKFQPPVMAVARRGSWHRAQEADLLVVA